MASERFESLSRQLGTPRRRRLALATALGGVLAAALGRDEAAAACAKIGKRCKFKNGKSKTCCGGAKCVGKTCRCTNGKENSGGVCGRQPICLGRAEDCLANSDCCSNACLLFISIARCLPSPLNEPCHDDDDCAEGLLCKGFVCKV